MNVESGSPLRILAVHNRYRSEAPSGEDRVVDQETAVLARAGHQVTLFERRSDDIASMSMPAKVAVPLRVPWNRSVRVEFVAQLRATQPDIVHIHNTFPLVSPSVLAACAEIHTPVVATLHNYLQACATGTLFRDGRVCNDCIQTPLSSIRHACYRGSRAATVPRTINLMANRRLWWSGVAHFFCVSESQRHILIESGMPAPLLSVKRNFVADPIVTRTGPGEHVLFLGRMTIDKGLPILMAAWDRLAAQGGVGVPLVLAGAGDMAEHVADWARDRHDVHYIGLQTKEQCQRLTAQASAVVVPSASLETFGLMVVEAMAAGVPTVAAAHGALAELVQDGVTGILHRPFDADSLADGIRRGVGDVSLNRAMGDAARDLYDQDFTPSIGLQALETGYRAVIDAAQDRESVRP